MKMLEGIFSDPKRSGYTFRPVITEWQFACDVCGALVCDGPDLDLHVTFHERLRKAVDENSEMLG